MWFSVHVTSTVHIGSSSHGVLWELVGNSFFCLEMLECLWILHLQYSDLNYLFRVLRHKNKETTLIVLSSLSSFHFHFTHTAFILTGNLPRLLFSFLYCVSLCRMREDMSSVVCVKETEGQGDPGEKLSQDELLCRTREVMQGLEALRAEHQAILEGLMGTLRCLKQSQEGRVVEEKTAMIQRSMEMLELGLSEAQVKCGTASKVG